MTTHFTLTPDVLATATPPSIFNDVFGPIMIGPSSSHGGASYRIGRLCLDLLGGEITSLHARYNRGTALANTHRGQGTNRGLYGALLGWDIVDPRMQAFDDEIEQALHDAGIAVTVEYPDFGVTHASYYHLTVSNAADSHIVEAVSTGGGMFKILRIDGAPVSMEGDAYELLLFCTGSGDPVATMVAAVLPSAQVTICRSDRVTFVRARSLTPTDPALLAQWSALHEVSGIRELSPVLPTLSRHQVVVPFLSASEMLTYNRDHHLALWQLALRYESIRGETSEAAVWAKMERIVGLMRQSVAFGLAGTDYADRILESHAPRVAKAVADRIVPDDAVTRMILYTTAVMDTKSAMGVFVAAPTAGSCGTTPGAILGFADANGHGEDEVVQAMLAAGLIGVFIAAHATFSAELAGCMAETGASGAMAAAGLVHLQGGDLDQSLTAAGSTIETGLGLICDMIADRVEAPCLAKNIAAGMRAYGASLTARMGFSKVIPFDEAVDAMRRIGEEMPDSMCCTGGAGLCQTCTGQRLHQQLLTIAVVDRPPGSLLIANHEIGS